MRWIPSPFANAISNILGWCSRKKMIWIYAMSVVAMVANVKTVWNLTEMQFITNAVSRAFNAKLPYLSVSEFVSRPNPTSPQFFAVLWNWTVFINPAPKPFIPCGIELSNPGEVCFCAYFSSCHVAQCNKTEVS